MAAVAGVLGFALGMMALKPILALIPAQFIGEEAEVHASPTAFLISISVALLLGIAFGMASVALVARRGAAENLLRRRTRTFTDRRGGQVRSLLSLISYLGSGEYREKYLGLKIPPTNLQDYHLEQARSFAAKLADQLVTV